MSISMYLVAKKFLHDFYTDDKVIIDSIGQLFKFDPTLLTNSHKIEFTVGYWHNSNRIHNWFITHGTQLSRDEFEIEYAITYQDLQHLLNDCNAVVADPNLFDALLPVRVAPHFPAEPASSNTLSQVTYTIELLNKVMAMPDARTTHFTYCADW